VTFKLTAKQEQQIQIASSDATHIMAYGGSRSGKTFGFVRAVLIRALAHKSRHAMLRYRFNHIKPSIIYDTLPKVMELCFPGVWERSHLDKTDWYLKLPNGSEVWFGGLDEKERTEKILGQEYATVYLNECSQIPFASREMAMTRLAQNTPLRLKAYYDCNPPGMAHWTYRLFIEHRDPNSRQMLAKPADYAAVMMNPKDNAENLSASYLEQLQGMSGAMQRRFWLGQFADMSESALWTMELIDQQRIVDGKAPDMVRIVVAVDPSGASGDEDERSDEIGIVVCGLGKDGKGYILEDLSGRMGPAQWGAAAVSAYDRWDADCIVAEENFGGAMVQATIRSASSDPDRKTGLPVAYRAVKASRGKIVRAEPIAALFDQQKVYMVGFFPELEDQMCALTTAGYVGSKSPDRADALVWGLTSLFPAMTKPERGIDATRRPQVNLGYSNLKRRRA